MSLWKTLVSSNSGDQQPFGADHTLKPSDFRNPQRLKEGFLWADSMIKPRACTIRDMSPLTAQVVLWQDDIKPAILRGSLKLYSSADRKEAECVVASRDGNVLSLRFMSAFRTPSRKYA